MQHLKNKISPEKIYFVGILTNVDKSILQIDFGNDFKVEKWTFDYYVKFSAESWGSSELDAMFDIDELYYASASRDGMRSIKHVYVVTKIFDRPLRLVSIEENSSNEIFRLHRICDFVQKDVERKVDLLRLLLEGDLHIPTGFFIEHEKEPLLCSRKRYSYLGNKAFKANKKNAEIINRYISIAPLKFKYDYLNLALQNFNKSYGIGDKYLEFLLLMMVLEGLFNNGKQESTNKIARGCAVLLGKTKYLSQKIFKDIKNLYGKRSQLLHEGKSSSVKGEDVLLLKNYVRKCLRHCLAIDLPKDDLVKLLNEVGFGCAKTLILKENNAFQRKLFPILRQLD